MKNTQDANVISCRYNIKVSTELLIILENKGTSGYVIVSTSGRIRP